LPLTRVIRADLEIGVPRGRYREGVGMNVRVPWHGFGRHPERCRFLEPTWPEVIS